MKKTCVACGMPMERPQDFAMGDASKDYCVYCARPDGTMRSYDEADGLDDQDSRFGSDSGSENGGRSFGEASGLEEPVRVDSAFGGGLGPLGPGSKGPRSLQLRQALQFLI